MGKFSQIVNYIFPSAPENTSISYNHDSTSKPLKGLMHGRSRCWGAGKREKK